MKQTIKNESIFHQGEQPFVLTYVDKEVGDYITVKVWGTSEKDATSKFIKKWEKKIPEIEILSAVPYEKGMKYNTVQSYSDFEGGDVSEDVDTENPLAELKSNVIEFDSGDYVYLDYEDGKLIAGSATNNGIIPEFEIEYDWDSSLDTNIEAIYDMIVEEHPEYLVTPVDESIGAETRKQHYTVNDVATFLKHSVENLLAGSSTNSTFKLDNRLAVCVGWTGGYDEDDDSVIHDVENPEFAIVTGIKVYTSDYMQTDFDYLNFPYKNGGDVIDTSISIEPDEDYVWLASDLLDTYENELQYLDLDKDGKVVAEEDPTSKDPDTTEEARDTIEECDANIDTAVTEKIKDPELKSELDKDVENNNIYNRFVSEVLEDDSLCVTEKKPLEYDDDVDLESYIKQLRRI